MKRRLAGLVVAAVGLVTTGCSDNDGGAKSVPSARNADSSATGQNQDRASAITAGSPTDGGGPTAHLLGNAQRPSRSSAAAVQHDGNANPPQSETTVASSDFPPATSCSVDSAFWGGPTRQQRSCRFTATASGGWNYYDASRGQITRDPAEQPQAEGWVMVTRDSKTTTYRTEVHNDGPPGSNTFYRIEGCGDDIIRPGDLVEVVVDFKGAWMMRSRWDIGVGAGQGYGCS